MPISVIDNFQINKSEPIDTRVVATNSSARTSITYKYDGLKVFQTDNRTTYTWNASASTWDPDTGLSNPVVGTGTGGFVSRWSTGSLIIDSMIYTSQTGNLNGFSAGLVGINTPTSGILSPKEAFQVNAPYSGGEAPPFVISKGSTTVIGENWYWSGSEQNFVNSKGSSILQFDNGNFVIKTRSASSPVTTYNKLKITATDLELSTYTGQTPPSGTIMSSIVARSIYYNNNLSAIKFQADGSWSGGIYPTNIVFYTMTGASQIRSASIRPNGTMIIGGNSTHSSDKLLVQGSALIESTLKVDSGIKFPSVQNSSTDPNTLDDYKEGTWVPTITGVTSYFTYSSGGTYTKIGRLMYISGFIKYTGISGVGAGSENNYISLGNLPTSPSGVPTQSANMGVWSINPSSGSASNRFFDGYVDNGTVISSYQVSGDTNIYFSTKAGSSFNPLGGNFATGSVVSFNMTFHL